MVNIGSVCTTWDSLQKKLLNNKNINSSRKHSPPGTQARRSRLQDLLTTRIIGDFHVYDLLGCSLKFAEDEEVLKLGAWVVKVVVQMMVWPWILGEAEMTCTYLLWLSVMLLITTRPPGSQLITGAQRPLYLTLQSTEMKSNSFTVWSAELRFVLHWGFVAATTVTIQIITNLAAADWFHVTKLLLSTRNGWQSLAYSLLGAAVSPASR